MQTEARVASHYGRGGLEERIRGALQRAGLDLGHLNAEDLSPIDEFHIGGLEATRELAAQMELRKGMRLLDVGSGIGGPARYFAAAHGCQVSGIDLTEEFVDIARALTSMVSLENPPVFRQASALAMPFEKDSFDGAYILHVGMNLMDKAAVFREARRVLKKGALFTVYDIVSSGDGAFGFPVPWAQSAETSFVEDAAAYRKALQDSGFHLEKERDRRQFAIDFTQSRMARMAEPNPPVMGLHVLIGELSADMMKNMLAALKGGVLAPVEMLARAV